MIMRKKANRKEKIASIKKTVKKEKLRKRKNNNNEKM